jgi:hypothetical protein
MWWKMKNSSRQARILGISFLQWAILLILLVVCCCLAGLGGVYVFGANLGRSLLVPTPSLSEGLPAFSLSTPESPASSPTVETKEPTLVPEPVSPAAGQQLYSDSACNFSVNYPTGGTLDTNSPAPARIYFPIATGTNLIEKYLEATCFSEKQYCDLNMPQVETSTAAINGIDFRVQSGIEGGAGNIYEAIRYTLDGDSSCISLTFILHSGQLAFYDPPVAAFDEIAEREFIEETMSTFMLLSP